MSLAKVVKELDTKPKETLKCAYAKMYDALPKDDKEALDSLFARGLSTRIITDLLAREGYKIGNESINSHKFGRCRCSN